MRVRRRPAPRLWWYLNRPSPLPTPPASALTSDVGEKRCALGKGKGKVLGRSPNSSVTVIPSCPSQHPFRLAGSQTP